MISMVMVLFRVCFKFSMEVVIILFCLYGSMVICIIFYFVVFSVSVVLIWISGVCWNILCDIDVMIGRIIIDSMMFVVKIVLLLVNDMLFCLNRNN